MKVAVIGSGAYGSYLIDCLIQRYPTIDITLFEVGNAKIKNEAQIGYKSNLLGSYYSGLEKGRFFGFGGTTTKWGGQLLTFSRNDFNDPSSFLKDVVNLNEKYKKEVFKRFGIKLDTREERLAEGMLIKEGVWLNYHKRNLFKYFKIKSRKNVLIKDCARVVKLVSNKEKNISKLVYRTNKEIKEEVFDHYFLTAGAFESSRILLNSKLLKKKEIYFSDHLSQKVFKITGSSQIGNKDFTFKFKNGYMITKRIVGEIDNISFFANPVYNSEFPFFQNLKNLLFKREYSFRILKDILLDLPSFFHFMWYIVIKKEIFVYKGKWFLYIDIENPINKSNFSLSEIADDFSEKGLDLRFDVVNEAEVIFEKAKKKIEYYLEMNNVQFESVDSKIQIEKSEDTYHPYGMLNEFDSIKDFYNSFKNLCTFHTGILPRAGGINTTASVFPIIEDYVNNYFNNHETVNSK